MAKTTYKIKKKRLTRTQKEANDFEWYKQKHKELDGGPESYGMAGQEMSEYKRMKVNYDIINNILDPKELAHITQPFGEEVGELPATMFNRDIISSRIKKLQGMEMKRPFKYKMVATNRDATTRKETEETNRIREYVVAEIVRPIRQEIELKYAQQTKGQDLTEEEKAKIQQSIEEEVTAQTPDRVKNYMQRKHQDPTEVMHHQIMEYLIKEQDLIRKFNKGWKHSLASAYDLYWVGIVRGKPVMKVVNPLYFRCDMSPDHDFIEQGEWATYEHWMYPSEVVRAFPDLTDTEIDKIYEEHGRFSNDSEGDLFRYVDNSDVNAKRPGLVRVLHAVWKDLRKVGYLTYIDDDGETQMDLVDETYKYDEDNGDIELVWDWIPETYETSLISNDIYKGMGPTPGQYKDLDNLYECKLPYHGAITDNLNSQPTCPTDRMLPYQYYVNIAMFRLEMLLSSDKGKKILMNINAVAESSGMDMKTWQYFFETTPFMWYNPNEEGSTYSDVNTIAKQLDLSLISDIGKYIDLINSLDQACGKSVGIPDAILGQVSASQEVGNTQHQINQTSDILEPYFDMHNHVKKNVMQSLIEIAKVAYSENPPEKLSYILDDMSVRTFEVDQGMLQASSMGLFVENSTNAAEVKKTLQDFAHAALQNQKAELSDVLTITRQEGSQEAEEILRAAEERRRQDEFGQAEQNRKAAAEEEQKKRDHTKETWIHEEKMLRLEEKLKKEREIAKQLILSAGFNEDKDIDNDGQLDIVELARDSQNAQIDGRKQDLEEKKFQHQKSMDKETLKMDKKKDKV